MDGIKSINKWFLHKWTLDTVQLYHLMGKMDIIKQLPGLMYGTFVDVTYGYYWTSYSRFIAYLFSPWNDR